MKILFYMLVLFVHVFIVLAKCLHPLIEHFGFCTWPMSDNIFQNRIVREKCTYSFVFNVTMNKMDDVISNIILVLKCLENVQKTKILIFKTSSINIIV